MSEASNKKPRRVLSAPGWAYHVVQPPFTVDRYPLTYWPQSSTTVNASRLPSPRQTKDMELAYRELVMSDWGAWQLASRYASTSVFLVPFNMLFLLLIAPLVPVAGGLGFAAVIGIVQGFIHIRENREFGIQTLFFLMVWPVVGLFVIQLAVWVNAYRVLCAVALSVVALVTFLHHAKEPVTFYEDWLYAAPALTPESRRNRSRISPGPALGFLAVVLGIASLGRTPISALCAAAGIFVATLVWRSRIPRARTISAVLVTLTAAVSLACARLWPYYSPTAAMLLITTLAMFRLRKHRLGRSLLAQAATVVAQYGSYGLNHTLAPGTWHPKKERLQRMTDLFYMMLSLAAPMCLGLCYYMPTDVFLTNMNRVATRYIVEDEKTRDQVERVLPNIDLDRIPKPLRDKPAYSPPTPPTTPPDPGKVAPGGIDEAYQKQLLNYNASYDESVRVWEDEAQLHAKKLRESLGADVRDNPQFWAIIIGAAVFNGDLRFLWVFLLAIFLAMFIPFLVLLAIYRDPLVELEALEREIEGFYDHENNWIAGKDQDRRTEWQHYVDRIRMSSHSAVSRDGSSIREAEHLFLGVEPYKKFPVLLERKILSEHAYIVGDTGSGKTALGIMPLLIQLIRGYRLPDGDVSAPPPIIVLDLKGDAALFHTLRIESEQRRQELGITDPNDPRFAFRFFTPEARATHVFNPLSSLEDSTSSFSQICHLLIDSLGLSHGEGYGRSYYSRRNRELLQRALRKSPESFNELKMLVGDIARHDRDLRVDCYELVATLEALCEYDQIAKHVPLQQKADAIHMPSVLEHSQVVYFWLPAALESISVREIGKLALYSLLSAAIERQSNRQPGMQSYLVIDEFQRIAGENFKIILEQARSFGIGAILANQSQADLKTQDADLRATIQTNTRFKQLFSVTNPSEIDDLIKLSGEEIAVMRSHTMASLHSISNIGRDAHGEDRTVFRRPNVPSNPRITKPETMNFTYSENIKTRFNRNDVARISDGPLDSFMHVSRGSGYTQFAGLPIPLRSNYPIPFEEYEYRRTEAPWPEAPEYTLLESSTSHEAIDAKRQTLIDELHAEMDQEIRDLFSEQQAENE